MELFIPKPVSHSVRLIAVASERLDKTVFYETLKDKDGNIYKIIDKFTVPKTDDIFPGGLLLLSTGKEVNQDAIWKHYPKSDCLYFFIVKPLNNERKTNST